jgi:hypothetical protein
VDLEEDTLEHLGDRCEVCGTKLSRQEMETAMESGTPALCSVHADELIALGDDEGDFGDD